MEGIVQPLTGYLATAVEIPFPGVSRTADPGRDRQPLRARDRPTARCAQRHAPVQRAGQQPSFPPLTRRHGVNAADIGEARA